MTFQLLIDNLQTAVAETISLPEDETILLGSDAQNGIRLEHPFVDAVHAQFDVTAQGVTLTDLGSVNGTAVNGHRIPPNQPVPLQPGDTIDVALFQLTLQTEASPETDAASPPRETPSEPPAAVPNAPPTPTPPAQNGPPPPDLPPKDIVVSQPDDYWQPMQAIGFEQTFSRYMQYLPALYDVPFMHRFLALFESLLEPIVWRIDSRDLLLDGQTAPLPFLPWLARWYGFTFDHTWTDAKKREFLHAAPEIYGWWGTARALQKVLDIYVGQPVTIIDDDRLPPFTFRVEVPLSPDDDTQEAISRLINTQKPAHTSFELHFTGQTG